MDGIKLSIPYDFIHDRTQLSWREILFGLDNELLSVGATVEMARADLEALASAEPSQETEEIRRKWLFLVLSWVLDNRVRFPDPLQMVEMIYADFGYPEAVGKFVRYMPSDEPDLGSRELNEQRLYEKWQRFVDEEALHHHPGS